MLVAARRVPVRILADVRAALLVIAAVIVTLAPLEALALVTGEVLLAVLIGATLRLRLTVGRRRFGVRWGWFLTVDRRGRLR